MSVYERKEKYLKLLANREYTVKELADTLFISEPTVRRDVVFLKNRELIECNRGIVKIKTKYADQRIPLVIRNFENEESKKEIALKAIRHIKDGDVIMLDASTTAYHIISHLTAFKNILVITNGAQTALLAAALGIKTICTGGEITSESFSYVGIDAENTLRQYYADVAFFSCRGISEDGVATDNSILENSIRRIMIQNSKKKILLCDKSKFGNKYLKTLCHKNELDDVISNN